MTVIEGIVEHGDARGRTIGFPTANLAICDLEVEDGVWAAQVRIGSQEWAVAAVSVGRRRTFYTGEGPRLLEAHLLDFTGDLYGRTMHVELTAKLRGQKSFPSVQALMEQLHRDVEATRQWAVIHCPWLLSTQGSKTRERALV
ncbi:riboflavin kinase [Kocuria sp. CCUG 69068]|uniref:riboflavin kinase n=1 Tax=Kocuria sp. CCUG 69068 TaxID=2043138 RepID=UPI001E5B85C6|nr:riboflavin kinase [Kocuria sp. CCUG 69068]